MTSADAKRGFTLLEVMVSLSILALSLVAIAGINANSFNRSNYARHITVATLLARSKMIDIEIELQDEGFKDGDQEFNGDFSDEGFSSMKWIATVRKVEVDLGQLLGGLLGGDVDPENLPDQIGGFLGALNGTSAEEAAGDAAAGGELAQLMQGGMLEVVFKQVGEILADSIREITLEITWGKEGVDLESVKFVQYVTTNGRINAPAGLPAQALTPGGRIGQSAIPPTLPDGRPNPAFNALPGGANTGRRPVSAPRGFK